jgi:type VI secretion system protein ImpK
MSQPPDLPEPPDSESTIMIPRPGSRRAGGAAPAPGPAPAGGLDIDSVSLGGGGAEPAGMAGLEAPPAVGPNPLVAHAAPLLNAVATIRRTLNHRNPAGLREDLLRAITDFENGARRANCSPEHVLIARYSLCTMLDETVGGMPWGESSGWSQRSLLVSMHKETFGGEKFFLLLDKALEDPRRNLDLIELMYTCIALGLEGRYRVLDGGRAQLDALRDRVHGIIRRERGEIERDLSPRWRGLERQPKALVRRIPAWLVVGGACLLLFLGYLAFALLLAGNSDPVFASLAGVRADPGKLVRAQPANAPPPPAAPPRLKPLLEDQIAAGRLNVLEDDQASYVVIHGDSFFEPGKAEIRPELVPVIERIAAEMDKVPGSISITGHTDNKPIRSLRFPSNFELSLERARGVAALMDPKLKDRNRIKTEGAAEGRPLAGNDTPEGRAKNRRVEITLRYAG